MEFNFEEEKEKLSLADESIRRIIKKYNSELMNLPNEEKIILQLHYCFKKLDTLKEMTPKGHYWDNKRDEDIAYVSRIIKEIAQRVFPGIDDFDEIRNNVDISMNGKLSNIINSFRTDLIDAYKKHCDHVYTVLPISGLEELEASNHRENQYLNSIVNGVFATSPLRELEKYIARANVGGMIARGKEIDYPSNPFLSISDDKLILLKPVSIYLSNVDLFEPQFDYEIGEDDIPRFKFGGEWVAVKEKIQCIETQTTYLPSSFVEENDVYYKENDDRIKINKPTIIL